PAALRGRSSHARTVLGYGRMSVAVAVRRLAQGLMLLLVAAAGGAEFLSPNPPGDQDLESFNPPPPRIRFRDAEGGLHARPFIYRRLLKDPLYGTYEEQTDRRYPLAFFSRSWGWRVAGVFHTSRHCVEAPGTRLLLLGSDELGRDVFAR